jgi:exopolyphosphatase/guanosine-5'-triphosphate,3'-diphosphate pyrophosphatase
MRLAVLDIGSNTAHLVLVDGRPDGTFASVGRQRVVLRLADAAFPSMVLPKDAAERLIETVSGMRAFATEHRADTLLAFATSAIREATNGMEVLAEVRARTGVPVKVLPGADEGRLTYLAARAWAGYSARRLLVLDIGGGSLEVAGGDAERPEFVESLPLGATRLTRRFCGEDPPDPDRLAALRVHALAMLGPLATKVRSRPWDVVCATSRTFRTLANVAEALPSLQSPSLAFGFAGTDGRTAPVLTSETVNLLAGNLAKSTKRERNRLKGLDPLRAGNVVAGSQIAALAMQSFGLDRMVLAPWALREGVIIEYLAKHPDGVQETSSDGRRRSAIVEFAGRYAWDQPHCRQVARLAVSIFDQTRDLHGLGAEARDLLEYAGLLHDVGAAVAQASHHKHSMYIIRNAELEGFTPRELLVMANVARYHRGALPAKHHVDYLELGEQDRQVVRRLGAILRVADGLDLDHFQLIDQVSVREDHQTVVVELSARDDPGQSVWAAERNGDLFEAEFGRRIRPQVATVA